MDEKIKTLLDFSTDAAIAAKENTVVYLNSAAQSLLPFLHAGDSLDVILHERFTDSGGGMVSGTLSVLNEPYRVRGLRVEEYDLYSFFPDSEESDSLLSNGLINRIYSEIGIEQLCMDQLVHLLLEDEVPVVSDNLAVESSLTLLRSSSYRLLRQISNLSLAASLRKNTAVFQKEPVELVELCWDIADSSTKMRSKKCPPVLFSSDLEELNCEADRLLLYHMLLNLVGNALEKCGPEDRVQLRLRRSGGSAVISVEDNGPGIPADVLTGVFSSYRMAPDENHLDRASSAGLGLYVADQIARLHGGALVIESREGHGTAVSIRLPLDPECSAIRFCAPKEPAFNVHELFLTDLSPVLDEWFYSPRGKD